MSHDIRTPMNAILGYVGLSRKYVHDAKRVLGYLLKVDIAGRYLLNLINEVLDLARIESGHITVSQQAVSIREEIARVTDMLSASAKAHHIEMGIRHEAIRDGNVYIDPLHFDQVLVNVISNAIKY
ncbi:MAG: hybrid sensor histidine kinase/response regulator, partial [Desulfovibrio sp.]|nr:hybrid sensor histidine kinase/response regulator [Desulfovibrio sp.]